MTAVAYVSGGGSGIGRAVAGRLAADGYHVVVFGRREQRLRETADLVRAADPSARIDCVTGDLAEPGEVEAAVAAARSAAGDTVDAVVNAAGGTSPLAGGSLAEVAAEWQDEWRINVLTAVLLTTAARPHLRRPGGRVVNVSSIAALRGGGSYGAAKAALHAWTYALAADLGPAGTANVVAPGYVEQTEFFGDGMTEERHKMLVDQTLSGRPGRPEDVAGAIQWLLSADAAHVTGQVIQVNGGALLGRG
jgi:3-oxoacyl-[acyl-carrier protein] reductase